MKMADDLYGKLVREVKPSENVSMHPTIIQNFIGEVTLVTVKDGKLLKVEQTSVATAKKFCLEVLGKEPIIFQKGWVQGSNGHQADTEEFREID